MYTANSVSRGWLLLLLLAVHIHVEQFSPTQLSVHEIGFACHLSWCTRTRTNSTTVEKVGRGKSSTKQADDEVTFAASPCLAYRFTFPMSSQVKSSQINSGQVKSAALHPHPNQTKSPRLTSPKILLACAPHVPCPMSPIPKSKTSSL